MQCGQSVILLGVLALGGWVHAGPSDWLTGTIKPDRPRELNLHDVDDVSFPISSCDPSVGVMCVPNACDKNNCSLIPNAKCIADRRGCEARFFKWNQHDKTFQDYSRMCHVSNNVANVQRFVEKAQPNDETTDLNTATDPKVLVDLFHSFTSLVVEIMLDIARYNSHVVKTDPTDTNVAKLRKVLRTIQSPQRTARWRLPVEDLTGEGITKTVTKLIKNFMMDGNVNSLVGSKEMEELKRKHMEGELSERAIIRTITRTIRRALIRRRCLVGRTQGGAEG